MAKFKNTVIFTISCTLIIIISACASMQSPTGGPRDITPPKIIKENPENLTRNFSEEKIEIEFDEFIKLSNEFTEISISPALDIPPSYKAKKQLLEIKFEEALEKNTTYTINFGKAVADVNESNILKNYTYVFSTGNEIDSLSISGSVISSVTKEKLKEVIVFILPLSQDSLFGKKRASIFSSTDSAGNFKLSNLREDTYRIYALNEQGGDRIYNGQNEEIGFIKDSIKLNKDTSGIVLEVFKEVPAVFSINDRRIENDGRITLTFNKPIIEPTLKIIEPEALDKSKTVEFGNNRDTATIWLPEITFDSLKVAVSSSGTPMDTIILRRNKRDTYTPALMITDNLTGTKLRPGAELVLKFSSPIQSFQETGISLLEDSVEVKGMQIIKSPSSLRTYNLKYPWKLKKKYIVKLNENAFTDIFGVKSKALNRIFELDSDDNYGSISIKVAVPDTSSNYIVQWIGEGDNILREDKINKNITLNYTRYPTAKYSIRVIYDENKNGQWDTGNIRTREQPEKIWTFDKVISLRPNWDLEENVTIPPPE